VGTLAAVTDKYLDHLGGVRLFSTLSRKELQKVAKAADELDLPEGLAFVQQGEPGHECFVIVEGTASVLIDGSQVNTLGPGDHFGELALLDGGPRTATVVASSPIKVLVIGQRQFASLLEQVPEIARKMLQSLASRIRYLDEQAHGA
jgi:CRP-like cAMP-binding protein